MAKVNVISGEHEGDAGHVEQAESESGVGGRFRNPGMTVFLAATELAAKGLEVKGRGLKRLQINQGGPPNISVVGGFSTLFPTIMEAYRELFLGKVVFPHPLINFHDWREGFCLDFYPSSHYYGTFFGGRCHVSVRERGFRS